MFSKRRLQILPTLISFAGFIMCATTVSGAESPYDIDLKDLGRPKQQQKQLPYELDLRDLKRPHVRTIKEHPAATKAAKATPIKPDPTGATSTYTVKSGDFLFLILMQHYGLSNDAAERLIPEVMRLNNISKATSLYVGQQLKIPVPQTANTAAAQAPDAVKTDVTTQAAPVTVPVEPTPACEERVLVALPSQPCQLTSEVATQLGLNISAVTTFLGAKSISIYHGTAKIAVVCGLAPAEAYTVERMLAHKGAKVLNFKSDESPRSVVETLAKSLEIPFSLLNGDTSADQPLTFLFPAASSGKDLKLIIKLPQPEQKQP